MSAKCFDILNFTGDLEDLKKKLGAFKEQLRSNSSTSDAEISRYDPKIIVLF